ncbi:MULTISPECIES: recombinase family protein [Sporolactobacillus]|uniref:DNA invertase Pin-like site-specific DNA recombinase n=1 Tax=Sporolactobacillus spathodeae TaxID=1465502 RepID=A0ABS2Q7T3_9BACL|nr:DNA invertase Pin-like site-specific DNA recombinase [Sporolactobacillus spathodeae]
MNKTIMDNIKKVAIYSRKSRDDETEKALKQQLETQIEKCEQNNWEYDVYKEVGSSQDKHRPQYTKMVNRIQKYDYDAVVCTDQDRITRSQGGFEEFQALLQEYNVLLITDKKPFDYNNDGDAFEGTIYAFVAKMEYMQTKKRLIRGKRDSARKGNWAGGKTPVGYSYDHSTKRLVPDENAPIIERIYWLYLSGKSSTEIERIFDLEGILTPSDSKWDKARISAVLANPVYKGTAIYGRTKVSKIHKKPCGKPKQLKALKDEQIIRENAHKPIISPVKWEKVKEIRESRATKPPASRIGKVIFTGLIKCGLCGRTHSFQRRKGQELRITSCQTRHYSDDGSYTVCKNKGVRLDLFEKVFYANFSQFVNRLELYLEDIKKNIRQDSTNPADEKTILKANIKKIAASIKRVQRGFVAEIYTEDEAQKEIRQLKTQKQNLEKQIERLDRQSRSEKIGELRGTVNKLKCLLNGTSDLETKEINYLLTTLIDHIEYTRVGDHKAEINIKIHYKGQTEKKES